MDDRIQPVTAAPEPGPADGDYCPAEDRGYLCTLERGHEWPYHLAHGSGFAGRPLHRWPAAEGSKP